MVVWNFVHQQYDNWCLGVLNHFGSRQWFFRPPPSTLLTSDATCWTSRTSSWRRKTSLVVPWGTSMFFHGEKECWMFVAYKILLLPYLFRWICDFSATKLFCSLKKKRSISIPYKQPKHTWKSAFRDPPVVRFRVWFFCLAVTRLQGKQRRNRPCKDDELVVMKWFQCIFLQNNMLLAKPSWYQINQMHLLTPCRHFRLSEKWVWKLFVAHTPRSLTVLPFQEESH